MITKLVWSAKGLTWSSELVSHSRGWLRWWCVRWLLTASPFVR